MEIKERLRFFFQKRGYDLKRIKGFNDDVEVIIKALNKQDALCALDLYSDLNIPILGGDVLFLNDNGLIEYTYDSWYSIPIESESYAYSGDSRSPIPMISVHSVGDFLYRRQS